MSSVNFFFTFWIFTINFENILGYSHLTDEETNNCSNYEGRRPHIWKLSFTLAHYALLTDPRSTSVQESDALGNVNIYQAQQFNCSFDEPIHWVFDFNPGKIEMKVEVDFSERITRNGHPIYTYTTNFRLLYYPFDIPKDALFSCEPVSLSDKCQRNFVEIRNGNFVNDPTPSPHESLTNTSNALLKSSESVSRKYFNERSCPLKLSLKVEFGNVVRYKWDTHDGSTKGIKKVTTQTNATTYFENAFILHKTYEPSCVQILNDTEDCQNCQSVSRVQNYTLNAVVFYGTHNDTHLLYKGFFSVPKNARSERLFFLEWQLSDMVIHNHMMQLIIPESVYANISFTVLCRVSIFLFSYGTIITDKDTPELENGTDEKTKSYTTRTEEYYKPLGFREVVRTMKFPQSGQVKTVSCFTPLKASDRWIVKSKATLVKAGRPPSIDKSFENATEFKTVQDEAERFVIKCEATGNPTPSLKWIFPSKFPINETQKFNITNGENLIKIEFTEWEEIFAGTYICEAKNFLGLITKSITLQHQVSESNNFNNIFYYYAYKQQRCYLQLTTGPKSNFTIILSSCLGGLVLLLGLLIAFLAWKIRKQRQEFEIQTQKAIEEFKNGIKTENMTEVDIQDPNFSILQLPYNENFELPQDKWKIENKILGTGQFGIVRMGSVILKEKKVPVAVKSLKSSVEIDEFKSFLFELKIMAYLGQHKNIVSLTAACTEGIDNRDIMIGVEFCENGSLLDFLRKYRGSFLNMVGADGKLISDLSLVMNDSHDYKNMSVICTHQLYRWAYHIACGMEYLKTKKVLHGDLAARNVLLTSRKVAKIGDFGLSRVLMNSDNYTKQTQTALPWKWMAIESLKNREFSFSSDVWAYGVCLYEIFTLGQSPYPGMGWSPNFITQLENGLRMEQPVFCTMSLYKIMKATWESDPNNRPSYAKIKRKLAQGLQRLSVLITSANKYQKEQPPVLITDSIFRQSQNSPSTMITLEIDDSGIYRNLSRQTMNYYKNDF